MDSCWLNVIYTVYILISISVLLVLMESWLYKYVYIHTGDEQFSALIGQFSGGSYNNLVPDF